MSATYPLRIYKYFLSLFFALNTGILKNPGIKFKPNGYIIDKVKLIMVSIINIIYLSIFIYCAKARNKIPKNNIKNKLKVKKSTNFIFKLFFLILIFFWPLYNFFLALYLIFAFQLKIEFLLLY